MSNSNKKGGLGSLLSPIVDGAALTFGLIAFCMLLVDCVAVSGSGVSSTYKGYAIVFGVGDLLGFSFLNFLAFFFVLIASVLVGLSFFGFFDKIDFDFGLIAAMLFAIAAVLFFFSPVLVNVLRVFKARQMAIGSIVAAILSLVSAVLLGLKQAIKFLEKSGYIKL